MDEKVTTVIPAGMEIVKPVEGALTSDQLKKFFQNMLVFTSPALVVFFSQLALGMSLKAAVLGALLILFGILADYFKKLQDTTPRLRMKE